MRLLTEANEFESSLVDDHATRVLTQAAIRELELECDRLSSAEGKPPVSQQAVDAAASIQTLKVIFYFSIY
jgi:hypothetical protein